MQQSLVDSSDIDLDIEIRNGNLNEYTYELTEWSRELLAKTQVQIMKQKHDEEYIAEVLQELARRLSLLKRIIQATENKSATDHYNQIVQYLLDFENGMDNVQQYIHDNPLLQFSAEINTACAAICAFLRQNVDIGGVVIPQP
jgi:DNA mismatch repair ATPase MutS